MYRPTIEIDLFALLIAFISWVVAVAVIWIWHRMAEVKRLKGKAYTCVMVREHDCMTKDGPLGCDDCIYSVRKEK